jgi:hypothetical protein
MVVQTEKIGLMESGTILPVPRRDSKKLLFERVRNRPAKIDYSNIIRRASNCALKPVAPAARMIRNSTSQSSAVRIVWESRGVMLGGSPYSFLNKRYEGYEKVETAFHSLGWNS